MNPSTVGFILRACGASRNVQKTKNIVLGDKFALRKYCSTSQPPSAPQPPKKSIIGFNRVTVGVASTIGFVLAYYASKANKPSEHQNVARIGTDISTNIPEAQPTKRIRGSGDNGKLKLTLYQYQSCPFCCKVRAYLDFKGLSYDVVEVNSVTQKEMNWSKYKKVPVLICETGNNIFQINDSTAIISCLETYLEVKKQPMEKVVEFYPNFESVNKKGKKVVEIPNKYHIMFENTEAPLDKEETQKWREWTDKHLVHIISPNIYRTPSESFQTFKIFSKVGEWDQVFSWFDRNVSIWAGSAAMFIIGKVLQRRHLLSDNVRDDLYLACYVWMEQVAKKEGAKFAGGSEPSLADLSVYGVLSAMEGTQAFEDALTHTRIGGWFEDVKREVNSRAGKRISLKDGEEEEDVVVA